jgi:hypothetical protein
VRNGTVVLLHDADGIWRCREFGSRIYDLNEYIAATPKSFKDQLVDRLAGIYGEHYAFPEKLTFEMADYKETITSLGNFQATFLCTMNNVDEAGESAADNLNMMVRARVEGMGTLDANSIMILVDRSLTGPPNYDHSIYDYTFLR